MKTICGEERGEREKMNEVVQKERRKKLNEICKEKR